MLTVQEIGVSYPTAWLMQHKIRKAMQDRDRRYRLSGLVELDEGYVGGAEEGSGRRGRGAKSKSVVAVAVEQRAAGQAGRPPIPGFAALGVVANTASASLDEFLGAKIAIGSHILSDGWRGYRKLEQKGSAHTATVLSKLPLGAYHALEFEAVLAGALPQS